MRVCEMRSDISSRNIYIYRRQQSTLEKWYQSSRFIKQGDIRKLVVFLNSCLVWRCPELEENSPNLFMAIRPEERSPVVVSFIAWTISSLLTYPSLILSKKTNASTKVSKVAPRFSSPIFIFCEVCKGNRNAPHRCGIRDLKHNLSAKKFHSKSTNLHNPVKIVARLY